MKFSRLRLEAQLLNGQNATLNLSFIPGCNIVVTDTNTRGKSSIINSLALGLGFDDLVKSNVSALVNDSLVLNGKEELITNAYIYIEITNEAGQILSVKRTVKPDLGKGMTVYRGSLLGWHEDKTEEYYIGQNSYAGSQGFHRLLSDFIGFPEIKVVSNDDGVMKLYLEYIMSAIFIEQKRGWADIMSNVPFYKVRDPKKTTISEILGMEYIANNLRRSSLKVDLDKLKSAYDTSLDAFRDYVNVRHFSLKGIPEDIVSPNWNPKIYRSFEGQEELLLADLIDQKLASLSEFENPSLTEEHDHVLQTKMIQISDKITELVTRRDQLHSNQSINLATIKRYEQRLSVLNKDLEKNKEEQKIRNLFGRDRWATKQECPVCEQRIDESLLSQVKSFPTMSIDENVKYISDQKAVLTEIIKIQTERGKNSEVEIVSLNNDIRQLLHEHSQIQRSLSGTIPSELMAQARQIAHVEQEIEQLTRLEEYSSSKFEKIREIYSAYHGILPEYGRLKSDLSEFDKDILQKFETTFKDYLRRLGYNSFQINAMVIDEITFGPRVIITTMEQRKKVQADFGSSASDWIRIITAYTLALHACRSNSINSNHPNVSIFDEPGQQKMDSKDQLKFFDIVSDVCKKGGQVIVAATDEDHTVREKAKSLGMNVIDFGSNHVLTIQ